MSDGWGESPSGGGDLKANSSLLGGMWVIAFFYAIEGVGMAEVR
jgi:hypothetical protein